MLPILYSRAMPKFPKPEDPLSRFAVDIFRVNGSLLRTGDRITSAIGQNSVRWHVLGQASFCPQTVAQIARNMGQARQGVQRVADRLVREGLAEYVDNPQDKRAKLLAVTAKGGAIMTEINARQEAWSQHITPKLGSDKLSMLARQLEEVAAVLEQNEHKQGA